MTLPNTIRIRQTECMRAEGEATTVAEGFTEAATFRKTTSEAMALGEAAFIEVELA